MASHHYEFHGYTVHCVVKYAFFVHFEALAFLTGSYEALPQVNIVERWLKILPCSKVLAEADLQWAFLRTDNMCKSRRTNPTSSMFV